MSFHQAPRLQPSRAFAGAWCRTAALFSLLVLFSTSLHAVPSPSALQPVGLTTEMQQQPIGIDTPLPRFAWTLRAAGEQHGRLQTAYRILVASTPAMLAQHRGDVWDSGRVAAATYWQIRYSGPPLRSHTQYSWEVQAWDEHQVPGPWSRPSSFTTGLLAAGDWRAQWIAAAPDEGAPRAHTDGPLPVFRKEFALRPRKVERALLFVSGLGQYEVRLNGTNVTATVLNPGWTNYRRTVPYRTYDVKRLLAPGRNTLGMLLGNGMYHVDEVKDRYTKFTGSMGQPKCILQLELRYTDGTEARVVSDTSWQTHAGPVTFSHTYGGEDYDARAEMPGWDRSGYAAAGWQAALAVGGPGGALLADRSTPLVVAEQSKPVQITTPAPGVTVYDLGVNMSGWPAITVDGPRGSSVRLLPGELLDSNGRVTQRSAAAGPDAPALFDYILRGAGRAETWHPRFSYYGFRYVEVTMQPAAPGTPVPHVLSLTGDFVHADVPLAGSFTTGNLLLTNIHRLIDRAVLSNLVSVLTDCPHREKLGWLEQTYLNASTLMFNYDVSGLYEKMARDMEDSQLPDGLVPSIAPEYIAFTDDAGRSNDFRDSPEWGSAVILSPWALFQFTGDAAPLEEAYPAMKRYVAHLRGRAEHHLLAYGLGDWYDIGPGEPGPSKLTGRAVTATATYYEDLRVVSQVAALLHHPDDAATYTSEADQVRDAFNHALFHPDTDRYDTGSQTAQAMPLALAMVPAGHADGVLAHLVEDIHTHGDHVTAGDVGFHYVVRALTNYGRSDVLAAMLSRTDSPSYGYQLTRGATTLTEAWDTNPADSQNHFMLGHGEEWFYRGLAGITIDMARGADAAIEFHPTPVAGVDNAAAEYHAPMGVVRSAWQRLPGGSLQFDVTVPVGAQASLLLPATHRAPAPADAIGVLSSKRSGDADRLTLSSGIYRFVTPSLGQTDHAGGWPISDRKASTKFPATAKR